MNNVSLTLDSLVLFCLHGDLVKDDLTSLSMNQWNELEFKLKHSSFKKPSGLLDIEGHDLESELALSSQDVERVKRLLGRMPQVLLMLSQLEKQGISVITKYESHYPRTFFHRLKKNAPLILYYCGDFHLLEDDCISITGPLNASRTMLMNTRQVVDKLIDEGYTLMTSGHKGCEKTSLSHQLRMGGNVVLFAADGLKDKRIEYLRYIKNRRLLIISHRFPDSPYDIVESIIRNSYIYALCTTTFIMHSEINTGSLWFSAMQNLKYRWSKILAIVDDEFYGNAKLVEAGAIPVTMEKINSDVMINDLIEVTKTEMTLRQEIEQLSIFDFIDCNEERSE